MNKILLAALSVLTCLNVYAQCPRPWVCEKVKLPVPYTTLTGIKFTLANIRAGYLPHQGTFRGNVIYFQGLGDSMLNHDPLFNKISRAGYRVLAFDYMGQGGSEGSMNKTRIEFIPWIGERVWNRFAKDLHRFPVKTVIGWSTGGLAAYLAATEHKADKVILLAPGLAPRKIVGEGLFNDLPNEITLETLTTDVYTNEDSNPHRERIKPNSPLKVPHFSINLLATAKNMEDEKVSRSVKGLVLLSGNDDTYVNAAKTKKMIKKNASHFQVKSYEGALHEIDNEREDIRTIAHQDILNFLNQQEK